MAVHSDSTLCSSVFAPAFEAPLPPLPLRASAMRAQDHALLTRISCSRACVCKLVCVCVCVCVCVFVCVCADRQTDGKTHRQREGNGGGERGDGGEKDRRGLWKGRVRGSVKQITCICQVPKCTNRVSWAKQLVTEHGLLDAFSASLGTHQSACGPGIHPHFGVRGSGFGLVQGFG